MICTHRHGTGSLVIGCANDSLASSTKEPVSPYGFPVPRELEKARHKTAEKYELRVTEIHFNDWRAHSPPGRAPTSVQRPTVPPYLKSAAPSSRTVTVGFRSRCVWFTSVEALVCCACPGSQVQGTIPMGTARQFQTLMYIAGKVREWPASSLQMIDLRW